MAILFDLDGTLLDSIELIVASFHHTRARHFGDRLPDEQWVRLIGTTLRDVFASMTESTEARDAMIRTYVEHNLAHHDELARPFADAAEAVHALRERGVPLAIVTSKMRPGAMRGLRLMGLEASFDAVITADDVERGKPDPEPVRRALELLGVRPGDATFVGDSPHDVEAGRAAGVRTAAVEWGPYPRASLEAAKPDLWLTSFADLLR